MCWMQTSPFWNVSTRYLFRVFVFNVESWNCGEELLSNTALKRSSFGKTIGLMIQMFEPIFRTDKVVILKVDSELQRKLWVSRIRGFIEGPI